MTIDSSPSRPRRRWRRRAVALAAVAAAAGGAWIGANAWIGHFLNGPAFREAVGRAAQRALSADCEWSAIRWHSMTARADGFLARGTVDSPFRELRLTDVSGTLRPRALLRRVWQWDDLHIGGMTVDFSQGGRVAASESEAPAAAATPSAPSWVAGFLPDRAELNAIEVGRAAFRWDAGSERTEGSGFAMTVRPAPESDTVRLAASGGLVRTSLLSGDIAVPTLAGTLTPEEFRLNALQATRGDAQIAGRGSVDRQGPPAFRISLEVSRLPVADCLPESWWQRCRGTVAATARIDGDLREAGRFRANGNVRVAQGLIEGLPALRVIARKTSNPAFLRVATGEAGGEFRREPDGTWQIERVRIDAPGLLRIVGGLRVDPGPDRSLHGLLMAGIVPGTLSYVAGAEKVVFLPAGDPSFTAAQQAMLSDADGALLWTPVVLSGTLHDPREDLSDRLARAWFDSTVEDVLRLTDDAAAAAVSAGAAAAEAGSAAAETVLEHAPDAVRSGIDTGYKALDSLLRK